MKCLLRKIPILVTILLLGVGASSQTVTGVIVDQKGTMLQGVSVRNQRTGAGTSSLQDGNYKIVAVNGDSLLFSSTGYRPVGIKVSGSKHNVMMAEEESAMDDVVVVGYGTQRKQDLTVSIEKVNVEDMTKAPVRSFDEALAGRVAGVQVTSSDGQPGAQSNIAVRGNNSITQDNAPLFIIDGFPVENPDNNVLNPQDIESIQFLKDASATAIYGSRGANGVIMITTKKGKEGAPSINFSASYSLQEVTKKMDMMSPYEFVKSQLERDTASTTSSPKHIYLTLPNRTLEDYKTIEGIDWQSKVLRRAPMKNYSLSVSGGTQKTKYIISGSVLDQDGIIINSNFKRYQGRVAIDQTISSKLKIGINANYSYMDQNGAFVAQSTNSATTNIMYGVWGYRTVGVSATDIDLIDLLFDPEVNPSNDYRINPYLNLKNAVNRRYTGNLITNGYLEYNITPELKFKSTGGINNYQLRVETFNNSMTQYGNPITSSNGINGSILYNDRSSWLNENILTYNRKFKRSHNLTLVGVASTQGGKTRYYGFSAIKLPNESLGVSGLDEGVPQRINAASSNWTLASFAVRANYNFLYRYYFTASYRADGSSRFAPGKRWGYFPAASFAWRFSNEPFFKKYSFISDAKLRIGYGANGNNRVDDFAYLSTIGLPIGAAYTIGNSVIRGSVPTAIGNPDLKWETTQEVNLGLDLSLFKNSISFTAEAYRKTTKDLLLNALLPYSTGYDAAFKNVGSVRNEGLEFTLNTINIKRENFSWTSSFNIAFNRNKVLALTENQESLTQAIRWDNAWRSIPAYIAKLNNPLGLMYGFIWDGVYDYDDFYQNASGAYVLKDNVPTNGNTRDKIQPGDIKYRDINGDGVVNALDYTIIGNGVPKHVGGFNNNFTYKGFDLNIFFQWSYGNDVFNINNLAFNGNGLQRGNLNQFASYENRWSPTNVNSDIFRTNGYFGGGYSSMLVEDASFLRLKTIALGYNLPEKLIKCLNAKVLRLSLSAQNLITWTKYSGMDPEVNTYNSALTPGFDWSAYPRARTLMIGLNLTF